MKNLSNFYLGLVFVFLFVNCNNGSADSVKNAKDSNAAKIDSQQKQERPSGLTAVVLTREDADFLVNAASGDMLETELGDLAQTNSGTPRVKAFGAMMIKDHGGGGEKLKALATAKNVTLPDSVSRRQRKEIEDLQKKKGIDFDKTYIRTMISNHKDDIKAFEKAASKGVDSSIRVFASSRLEMLHKHLDSADNLRKLLGIDYVRGTTPPIP
jgi:putative membrane protein